MALPVFITTSDPGGGRPRTRHFGPLYLGHSTAASVTLGLADPTAHSGSASFPILAFWNRQDMGLWAASVTSSAGGVAESRYAVAGGDVVSLSSVGLAPVAATSGFYSTAATGRTLYVAQTSVASLSSAAVPGLPPSGAGAVAAVVWDGTGKQLWIYSTVSGWLGIGRSTTGANLWFTSSGA